MSNSHFEQPIGVVDGVNLVYITSTPYKPNTLAVYVGGILRNAALANGFLETNPSNGTFTMKQAIGAGTDLQVYYWDTLPESPHRSVSPLRGVLRVKEELIGKWREKDPLMGRLDPKI